MGPTGWSAVCPATELEPGRGVSALVHGQSMAIFRTGEGEVYALGNHDPFDRTAPLSKGIVGTRDGQPIVGSPRHRHTFDLATGRCLEDEHVSVPAYHVRVEEGVVLVGPRRESVTDRTEA